MIAFNLSKFGKYEFCTSKIYNFAAGFKFEIYINIYLLIV